MRPFLKCTLALAVLGAAGCGGDDDTATKTVTVAGETVTSTQTAPAPAQTPDASGDDGVSDSPGPPLPAGVVGVDGRYLLKTVNTDYDGPGVSVEGVDRFSSYEEPSNATTTCVAKRCSVLLRFGLKSGGSKAYTLRADPNRQRTYVGTGTGQLECGGFGGGGRRTKVQSRERIAVRAGSPTKIGDRQVAGRLSLYATITARCPVTAGTGMEALRLVATLRGPREPR